MPRLGGIGGAMDLVAGKQTLIVMMEHRDSQDRAKLVRQTAVPADGRGVRRRGGDGPGDPAPLDGQWRIEQIADGFTADEIQALTEHAPRRAVARVTTPRIQRMGEASHQ